MLYELWKDSTSFSLVGGDFNCIHSKCDFLNNPQVQLQPALVKFMQTYNLENDYMKYVVERGDGITYRFIKVFWKNKLFREIYVDF